MLIYLLFFPFFRRLGEPIPFRGRQTLCKYYDHNEILNDQLLQIKSARTVQELEKLFNQQFRHHQGYPKSAKSVEPYYDIKEILNPLKPFASETCLCTKDPYRLNENRLANEQQQTGTTNAVTSNAIRSLNGNKKSIEDFVNLASECYDNCINIYLTNLDDCNQRAENIVRQSLKAASGYAGKRSLRSRKINDLALANEIKKLSISLDTHHHHRDVVSHTKTFYSARQSTSSTQNCSYQTMSCNDTNNNSTESTNQLKDPPKIILSDHSTKPIQGDNSKEYSDSNSAIVKKNSLTIPIENYYSSEARPP